MGVSRGDSGPARAVAPVAASDATPLSDFVLRYSDFPGFLLPNTLVSDWATRSGKKPFGRLADADSQTTPQQERKSEEVGACQDADDKAKHACLYLEPRGRSPVLRY